MIFKLKPALEVNLFYIIFELKSKMRGVANVSVFLLCLLSTLLQELCSILKLFLSFACKNLMSFSRRRIFLLFSERLVKEHAFYALIFKFFAGYSAKLVFISANLKKIFFLFDF